MTNRLSGREEIKNSVQCQEVTNVYQAGTRLAKQYDESAICKAIGNSEVCGKEKRASILREIQMFSTFHWSNWSS